MRPDPPTPSHPSSGKKKSTLSPINASPQFSISPTHSLISSQKSFLFRSADNFTKNNVRHGFYFLSCSNEFGARKDVDQIVRCHWLHRNGNKSVDFSIHEIWSLHFTSSRPRFKSSLLCSYLIQSGKNFCIQYIRRLPLHRSASIIFKSFFRQYICTKKISKGVTLISFNQAEAYILH